MLRESARSHRRPINLAAVTSPLVDPELPLGRELVAYVDAIVLLDADEVTIARDRLLAAAGPAVVTQAAAVCANFECTNRVIDAIGVPVNPRYDDIGAQLGLTVPEHLR